MSSTVLATLVGQVVPALAGGSAFGAVYFAALRRTADTYVAGRGWMAPAALTLGRIVTAGGFFALVASFGAMPLLISFLGFLVARSLAVRAAKEPA